MLRKWGTLVVAAAFVASSTAAFAGTGNAPQSKQQGALAPGNAAGVEQAEKTDCHCIALIITGGALIAGGLALALSGSSNGPATTTTTTTTTTTP